MLCRAPASTKVFPVHLGTPALCRQSPGRLLRTGMPPAQCHSGRQPSPMAPLVGHTDPLWDMTSPVRLQPGTVRLLVFCSGLTLKAVGTQLGLPKLPLSTSSLWTQAEGDQVWSDASDMQEQLSTSTSLLAAASSILAMATTPRPW